MSDEIKSKISALIAEDQAIRARLIEIGDEHDRLVGELHGIKPGDNVTYREVIYIVSRIKAFGFSKPSVQGNPIKNDGTPSKAERHLYWSWEKAG